MTLCITSTHTHTSCTILVWCKTNPTPATNGNWLPDLEYCLYFRESGLPKLNDGYDLKSKFFVSSINVFDKKRYNHPTIKPIELVKRHLLHATQPNDLILDPFSGSGTTCKAAQETGRRYLGFEINEEYYRCSLDRLEGYDATGQRALW